MWYFSNFPKANYEILGNQSIVITDISRRFKFVEKVLKNKYILYNYVIREGERPDTIAYEYYGDSKLDWIVLLTNKVIDPYFDWPLNTSQFDQFMIKKYGSIETAKNIFAKFYKIIQAKQISYDGYSVPERVIEIDETMYQTLVDANRKRVTAYDYEQQLNEDRKAIKLIDKVYTSQIISEAEKLYV
jgi:hypothetical protein